MEPLLNIYFPKHKIYHFRMKSKKLSSLNPLRKTLKNNALLVLSLVFISGLVEKAEAGRIRLRKVKEAPKTCSTMAEDQYLSKPDKRILGTLKNSLIFEDDITVVDDLGKKVCQWSYDNWTSYGDLSQFQFFINEQKNELIPFQKNENGYLVSKIDLSNCEMNDLKVVQELQLPKCESSKKRTKLRTKKSKHTVAGIY